MTTFFFTFFSRFMTTFAFTIMASLFINTLFFIGVHCPRSNSLFVCVIDLILNCVWCGSIRAFSRLPQLFSQHGLSLLINCTIYNLQVWIYFHRQVIYHLHVAANLSRDFFENFFRQVSSGKSLMKPNELHNITLCLYIFVIAEQLFIRIQLMHHWELFSADSYNNDRAG